MLRIEQPGAWVSSHPGQRAATHLSRWDPSGVGGCARTNRPSERNARGQFLVVIDICMNSRFENKLLSARWPCFWWLSSLFFAPEHAARPALAKALAMAAANADWVPGLVVMRSEILHKGETNGVHENVGLARVRGATVRLSRGWSRYWKMKGCHRAREEGDGEGQKEKAGPSAKQQPV